MKLLLHHSYAFYIRFTRRMNGMDRAYRLSAVESLSEIESFMSDSQHENIESLPRRNSHDGTVSSWPTVYTRCIIGLTVQAERSRTMNRELLSASGINFSTNSWE